MKQTDYLHKVRKQYEEYPYPERNPLDEKKRLVAVGTDCLDLINHYSHAGHKDFSKGIRVLVAGGGTGDSTIFLAEQLRNSDSEIIYVDISKASMKIAQERASIRGLNNITWMQESLLNIPSLDLGKFDHISCTGVLHHLEDPIAGVKSLESVLAENGAIHIMVYARYGRTSIYQMQELMRLINHNEVGLSAEIKNARRVLKELPPNHWHKLANMHDDNLPDIEFYDLYLHSQDRAYTVPELYQFAESANLELVQFMGLGIVGGNEIYKPEFYIQDKRICSSLKQLNVMQRQAIAEIFNGRIIMHSFNLTRKSVKQPNASMLDFIPSLSIILANKSYEMLHRLVCSSRDFVHLTSASTNLNLKFPKTPNAEIFFEYMDGRHSFKQIFKKIMSSKSCGIKKVSHATLIREFRPVVEVLSAHNQLFMRHKSVPPYKTTEDIESLLPYKQ